jgi:hypothetical protein
VETPADGLAEIYEEIRTALFQDNATAGEAAGYAMGLVMLGTASEKALEEMMSYARETQHEKIIRSLAVGIAFVMYGQREKADEVIKGLTGEKVSPIAKLDFAALTLHRTRSCGTEGCSQLPSPMLELGVIKQSANSCMSRCPTSMTMFAELRSPVLASCFSAITRKSLEWSSCSPRASILMSDMARP